MNIPSGSCSADTEHLPCGVSTNRWTLIFRIFKQELSDAKQELKAAAKTNFAQCLITVNWYLQDDCCTNIQTTFYFVRHSEKAIKITVKYLLHWSSKWFIQQFILSNNRLFMMTSTVTLKMFAGTVLLVKKCSQQPHPSITILWLVCVANVNHYSV